MNFKEKFDYRISGDKNYSYQYCSNCQFSYKYNKKLYCENIGFDCPVDERGTCEVWKRKI